MHRTTLEVFASEMLLEKVIVMLVIFLIDLDLVLIKERCHTPPLFTLEGHHTRIGCSMDTDSEE